MPLLEVVRAEATGDDAYDLGFELGEKLGKTTVAAGDNRGFIVNRLLVPYMLDAIRAHEQGVGSIEDIDTGMMAGASHPMGPLTLADFVGLDTLASIADVMVDAYGEERFAPAGDPAQAGRGGRLRPQVGPRLLRLLGREAGPGRSGALATRPSARAKEEQQWTRTASSGSAAPPSTSRGAATTRARWTTFLRAARRLARDGRRRARLDSDAVRRELERVGERTAKVLARGRARRAERARRRTPQRGGARDASSDARVAGRTPTRVEADALRRAARGRRRTTTPQADASGKADAYAEQAPRAEAEDDARRCVARAEDGGRADRRRGDAAATQIVDEARSSARSSTVIDGPRGRAATTLLDELEDELAELAGRHGEPRERRPPAGGEADGEPAAEDDARDAGRGSMSDRADRGRGATSGRRSRRRSPAARERHHEKTAEQGKLPVRERVERLVDPESFAEEAPARELGARRASAPTASSPGWR